ncbi:MAG TPA: FecR domain-containing protein [Vicinamibacteria bacterium]|nr:FecR domain-containing protein [Vicinamibacteria bacterium]
MSNVNVPSGPGDRRLRVWRLLGAVAVLVAALGLGYSFLQDQPPAPPSGAEAPKDIAATFESIQGNVKTRGVGGLDWRTAETRVPLRKSDLVRTYPSSSAEIKFFDETRVTVRPDSLITIEETSKDPNSTSSKVAWKVSSGEINYETTQRNGGSTEAVTPTFRLALEGNSAGTMRVGEGGLTSVAQLAGAANIETKTGQKIRLGANEGLKVDASGKAGAKQILPDPPSAAAPGGASGLLSLAEGAPVPLSWSASAGASSYRVQVELKNGSGREVVFDQNGLKGTSASIPGLSAGEFTFRVAGLTDDGVQGKFSALVAFKVERTAPPRPLATAPAPSLTIEAFEARNNVLRLVGKTVPGAKLTVNGEPVTVQPDGSFREFVTLARKQGEQRVVIRSTSAAGGVAEETRTLPPGQ